MTKNEFLEKIASRTGFTKIMINSVLDAFCKITVSECLENREEINISGFGKFKQKVNKKRTGVTPITKKPYNSPESRTLYFSPSATIKKIIK